MLYTENRIMQNNPKLNAGGFSNPEGSLSVAANDAPDPVVDLDCSFSAAHQGTHAERLLHASIALSTFVVATNPASLHRLSHLSRGNKNGTAHCITHFTHKKEKQRK